MEIFLGAREYNFQDESTKRNVAGVSVYIAENEIAGVVGYSAEKVSMSIEDFAQVFSDLKSFEKLTMKPVKIAYNKRGKPIAFELIQSQGK